MAPTQFGLAIIRIFYDMWARISARIRGLRTRQNESNDKAIRCRVSPPMSMIQAMGRGKGRGKGRPYNAWRISFSNAIKPTVFFGGIYDPDC